MIGIQDGYNKNFHIECIEYYEKFDTWWLFLGREYGGFNAPAKVARYGRG